LDVRTTRPSVLCTSSPIFPARSYLFFCFFFFYSSGDHRDLHSFPTRRSSDLLPRRAVVGIDCPDDADCQDAEFVERHLSVDEVGDDARTDEGEDGTGGSDSVDAGVFALPDSRRPADGTEELDDAEPAGADVAFEADAECP